MKYVAVATCITGPSCNSFIHSLNYDKARQKAKATIVIILSTCTWEREGEKHLAIKNVQLISYVQLQILFSFFLFNNK